MRVLTQNSWQQKIDPAFDGLIRFYRNFLELICLPRHSGFIALEDDSLRAMQVNGFPSLVEMYKYEYKASKSDVHELTRAGANSDLKLISTLSVSKSRKSFLKMIDGLPLDSKEYYSRQLRFLQSEEQAKSIYDGKSEDEKQALIKEIRADFKTLSLHAALIGQLNSKKSKPVKDAKRNRISMIKNSLLVVYDTVSRLTYKKSIKELVKEARDENDDSLFGAVQIDKSLFDMDWVRKRIRKAQLSGDSFFFEKLGEAIKKTPLDHDIEYGELILILTFFWDCGLYRLTIPELIGLLEAGGVPVQEDPETFKKFVYRLRKEDLLPD